MSWWQRVPVRLLATYLVVVAAGAVTLVAVASLVAPSFFDTHMARMGMGRGMGMMAQVEGDVDAAFSNALRQALLVGVLVSVAVALVVAVIVARRIGRPLEQVRAATHRMAEGNYGERVPLPSEEELRALAIDVNSLAASLEETEKRRLELIGDLSHELRTPLTTIEAYMEGLIDGVIPAEPEVFASVAEEAGRLKRLASDLSALSRIQEETEGPEPVETDLGALTSAVSARLRQQYDDQGVALSVDTGSLPVWGDPDRLTQLILNLLGNALSHTASGGRVEVSGRITGEEVELSVRDTGRGIDPADLPRIFDRFYRADPSIPGGSGIGLTIARAIAREHGGDLTAHSEGRGTGASFVLRLPAR